MREHRPDARQLSGLVPALRCAGVPLFDGPFAPSTWRLVASRVHEVGVAVLTYERA